MKIRQRLGPLAGIESLEFNVVAHRLRVRHSIAESKILDALPGIGLPGYPIDRQNNSTLIKTSRKQLLSTSIAAALLVLGLIVKAALPSSLASHVVFIAAILIGGVHIFVKTWKSVRNASLDVNILMTTAVIGALALGNSAEASAVTVFYSMSLLLESLSADRARNAIRSLLRITPPTASVIHEDREIAMPVASVKSGTIILVRPGERIPLDGIVVEGTSSVDQSLVTGESMPVVKHAGSDVFAGSLNQRGALRIRATKPSNDSTLAHIIHLVEDAQIGKAKRQLFVETFATYYTPAMFIAAFFVAVVPPLFTQQFHEWFYRALVLLVISCPCALLISTPVTIVSALTAMTRIGLLFKGGKHIETFASVRAMAFDKTGTLTEGKLRVNNVVALHSLNAQEILEIAAALEVNSEHPMADAVIAKALEEGFEPNNNRVRSFEAIHGKGIRADFNGQRFFLGNYSLIDEQGLATDHLRQSLQHFHTDGRTVLILADANNVLGLIVLSDLARSESAKTIDELHHLGIRPIVLLTGDHSSVAESIGKELGIDHVHAELLPENKLNIIEQLKSSEGTMAMVGDGINDAPALAAADVSIAIGNVGSDTAIETADAVLISEEIHSLPQAIRIARKAMGIIKQNIAFALLIKIVFLFLGVFGVSTLWFAILADDGAALLVVFNSLRLLKK
ncbi:MAG: cation-translocating P-type ATPase [Ignavibacteriales bacterium]|nr:cation-translocating P-type ATPase [Ignavibacteriales bacterium]